jgi:hypothetical protein
VVFSPSGLAISRVLKTSIAAAVVSIVAVLIAVDTKSATEVSFIVVLNNLKCASMILER